MKYLAFVLLFLAAPVFACDTSRPEVFRNQHGNCVDLREQNWGNQLSITREDIARAFAKDRPTSIDILKGIGRGGSRSHRGVYTFGDNYMIGPDFSCYRVGRTMICN